MSAATRRGGRKTASRKSARRKPTKKKTASRKTAGAATGKRNPTLKKRMEKLARDMAERGIRLEEALEQLEKCFLEQVLSDEGGNQTRAAARLHLHRNTLRRKMERHGLS